MLKTILTAALAVLAVGASAQDRPTLEEALMAAGIGRPVNNLSCGIPPIPPIGCKVGDCVCDQNGNNCRWTFICGGK